MAKFDSFFSEKPPEGLNKKILARAQTEMEIQKQKDRKSKWFGILLPWGTAFAVSALAFYLNQGLNKNKTTDGEASVLMTVAALGHEFVNEIIEEEEETLEIVDELGVIEEYETLVAISDTDLEG